MKYLFLLIFSLLITSLSYAQTCVDCNLIDPDGICPAVFQPVCGCNGVSYSNSCIAEITDGITVYSEGECPGDNVSICSNLADLDFGACAAIIGYASINGTCTAISGCGTIASNGIDYAAALFDDIESCQFFCTCNSDPNSLNEHKLEFSISPIPAQNNIKIYYNSSNSFNVEIVDITGRSAMEVNMTSGQNIDVSGLNEGLYILLVKSDEDILLSKRIPIKH